MKIFKYWEFLFENNTPEDFMTAKLEEIKRRIDSLFSDDNEKVKKMSDFKNSNLKLIDSKTSTYGTTEYSYKAKFEDEQSILYILTVIIKLEDAISPDKEVSFKLSDIKKAHVTFVKYGDKDGNYEKLKELLDRVVEPDKIDGDYIISLKVEMEEGTTADDSDEEEFKIETEEPKAQAQKPAQGQKTQEEPVQSLEENKPVQK